MNEIPGVTTGERRWHPESPHGVNVHIEQRHFLIARRFTSSEHDTADLGETLTIDLNVADDRAGAALVAFCRAWCEQPMKLVRKKSAKRKK